MHVTDQPRSPVDPWAGIATLLELFARRPAPGWDVWGNEVTDEKDTTTP